MRLEGLDIAELSILRDAWLRQAPQDERGTKIVKIEGCAVIGPHSGPDAVRKMSMISINCALSDWH
jgi:hypothetical protein